MPTYSTDVLYAYAMLGLDEGAALERVLEVLAHAAAYRFFTKARVEEVRRYTDFFVARALLGSIDTPFAEIKKAYHRKAMALHPDRNKSDFETEEQLKAINSAYGLVEATNRKAKAFYKKDEAVRREIVRQAREKTESERPASAPREKKSAGAARHAHFKTASAKANTRERASASSVKYMAAAIPRSIRVARLGYLPVHAIIGCTFTPKKNDLNLVFDIVMLPEKLFQRARSYLATPDMTGMHLTRGGFSPPYVLQNVKEVVVPVGEEDPERFARAYFVREFGL